MNLASKPKFQHLPRLLTTQNASNPKNNSFSCKTQIFNKKENESNSLHLELLPQFHKNGSFSSPFTLSKIISICAKSASLFTGIQLHATAVKMGFISNLYIYSALIAMYGENGAIFSAQKLFDEPQEKNEVCWNSLISGYVHVNFPEIAVKQFIKMIRAGVKVTTFTFSEVLVGCSKLEKGELGAQVHCFCLKVGYFDNNVVIGTGLLDMYSKCWKIEDSRRVFDEMMDKNEITWTTMVSGYAQNRLPCQAMDLAKKMLALGIRLNHVACNSLLSSFLSPDLNSCRQIHSRIIQDGLESNVYIVVTLLTVYSRSSCSLEDFQKLCESVSRWDQVSCNAVISGFCNLGFDDEAMKSFVKMKQEGIDVDYFTFSSTLGAIGNSSVLERGKQIHALIWKTGYVSNIYVQNGLVSMYARCGMINDSKTVFLSMEEQDVISWNSLLFGFAHHGHGKEALDFFGQMRETEIKPNGTTFLAILSACSHVGFLDNGLKYFELMKTDTMLEPPGVKHYAAVVNLFGKAGYLNEAEAFVNSMPIEPGPSVYKALLSACEVYRNVEIAERSAKRLLELWPNDPGTYVLLSKVLKMVNDWDDAAGSSKLMSNRGVRKNPGCSWI